MRFFKTAFLPVMMLLTCAGLARADVKVVASIKPIHSLVALVMQDAGVPVLLIEGVGSPHSYSLKPSQARELQAADIIFWIGPDLEAFLENSIENIAANAVSVRLIESPYLSKLGFREAGAFDAHGHKPDDHRHEDDHNDHKDDHGHDESRHDDHGPDDHGHDESRHDASDPHIWLDPQNAKLLVQEIAKTLAGTDPENAALYRANAAALMNKLDSLTAEIEAELRPVRDKGFVVFHDGYQYFERRFGLSAIGSITLSPEVMPGADRIRELRKKIRQLDARCVFSEPQFEPRLVATVTENSGAGSGVLDPLGAALDDGPQLYFTLIREMARSVKECLTRAGS